MLAGFTWFKQSAYRWQGDGLTVYLDPWGVDEDVPADVVFITHAHLDHFSPEDIERIRRRRTRIVAPADVADELTGEVTPVAPGDALQVGGVDVQAVPAYNVVEERLQAHPRENGWVGYVLDLAGRTYYHAGDTDHVPELETVGADVTFLPIGGTFTMTAPEAAGLARIISPRMAVPMHYGYRVGTAADAETFRREAAPVEVEVLEPVHPFERS